MTLVQEDGRDRGGVPGACNASSGQRDPDDGVAGIQSNAWSIDLLNRNPSQVQESIIHLQHCGDGTDGQRRHARRAGMLVNITLTALTLADIATWYCIARSDPPNFQQKKISLSPNSIQLTSHSVPTT